MTQTMLQWDGRTLKEVLYGHNRALVWTDGTWRAVVAVDRQDKFLWMKCGKPYRVLYFFASDFAWGTEQYEDCPAIPLISPPAPEVTCQNQ